MISLHTSYFTSQSEKRQEEIDSCLRKNLNNELIEEVNLFVSHKDVRGAEKVGVGSKKLRLTFLEGAPSYYDWLRGAANREGISLFANSDIYFDETVSGLCDYLKSPKSVVCLSRYEEIEDVITHHKNPKWSQDAWAIDTKNISSIRFMDKLNIRTGLCRCDNKLLYHFAVNGWDVFNPMSKIRCIHRHSSGIRNYKRTDQDIIGAIAFAHPSEQDQPSKIEMEIMPLKNDNITGCRINDFLQS